MITASSRSSYVCLSFSNAPSPKDELVLRNRLGKWRSEQKITQSVHPWAAASAQVVSFSKVESKSTPSGQVAFELASSLNVLPSSSSVPLTILIPSPALVIFRSQKKSASHRYRVTTERSRRCLNPNIISHCCCPVKVNETR